MTSDTDDVRALLAVVMLHGERRHVTMRDVASACGRSTDWARHHLETLRDLGLVTWEPGAAGGGTLRPLVSIAMVPRRKRAA